MLLIPTFKTLKPKKLSLNKRNNDPIGKPKLDLTKKASYL
jgi:hypothetical protein